MARTVIETSKSCTQIPTLGTQFRICRVRTLIMVLQWSLCNFNHTAGYKTGHFSNTYLLNYKSMKTELKILKKVCSALFHPVLHLLVETLR